jgi:hypothetical protein
MAPRPIAPAREMDTPTVLAAAQAEPARMRSAGRRPVEDYSYVRRDIQRIAVLATAVVITLIVLSFFLP